MTPAPCMVCDAAHWLGGPESTQFFWARKHSLLNGGAILGDAVHTHHARNIGPRSAFLKKKLFKRDWWRQFGFFHLFTDSWWQLKVGLGKHCAVPLQRGKVTAWELGWAAVPKGPPQATKMRTGPRNVNLCESEDNLTTEGSNIISKHANYASWIVRIYLIPSY